MIRSSALLLEGLRLNFFFFHFFTPACTGAASGRRLKVLNSSDFCADCWFVSGREATERKFVHSFLRRPPLLPQPNGNRKQVCPHFSALTSAVPVSLPDIHPTSKNAFSSCSYILLNICNLKRHLI